MKCVPFFTETCQGLKLLPIVTCEKWFTKCVFVPHPDGGLWHVINPKWGFKKRFQKEKNRASICERKHGAGAMWRAGAAHLVCSSQVRKSWCVPLRQSLTCWNLPTRLPINVPKITTLIMIILIAAIAMAPPITDACSVSTSSSWSGDPESVYDSEVWHGMHWYLPHWSLLADRPGPALP